MARLYGCANRPHLSEMTKDDVRQPRQARALKTRGRLLDAVSALAVDPEASLTTSEIAAAAGVSVGSVYRYFEDGDAAVLCAYDEALGRVNGRWFGALPDLVGLAPRAQARAFLDAYLKSAEQEPNYAALLRHARRRRTAETEYAVNIETPESHAAFASLFGLPNRPEQMATIKLLKFVTQRLTDLYFSAAAEERAAIAEEIVAYTAGVLERLRNGAV